MKNIIGNFNPTADVKKKASEIIFYDDLRYSLISEIVCKCQFNAGLFFEDEVKKAISSPEDTE